MVIVKTRKNRYIQFTGTHSEYPRELLSKKLKSIAEDPRIVEYFVAPDYESFFQYIEAVQRFTEIQDKVVKEIRLP